MGKTKIIGRILSILSMVLAICYLATAAYGTICLVSGWNITPYGDGKYLHINYPFSEKPFLNVDNNAAYLIFSFFLPLSLYGAFFWFTADVFKVFSREKLFTTSNLFLIKRFYLFNLLAPIIAVLLSSFFVEIENVVEMLVLVHIVLGIFAWFLAAIFKQGLKLQNEQDLFI